MRGKLEFDLWEDREAWEITVNAIETHSRLGDFAHWLRRKYKHVDPKSDAHYEEYEEILDKFWDMMRDLKVEL